MISIGDIDHSMLGAYGPGNNFSPQKKFNYFGGSFLNLSVSTNESGILLYEGVTYNWLRRQLVFCGGQQVIIQHFWMSALFEKKSLFVTYIW